MKAFCWHTFLFLAVFPLIMLGGCANYNSTSFYGIRMGKPPLAFIIDISGSMGTGVGDTARSNIALSTINKLERNTGSIRTGVSVVDSLIGGVRSDMFNAARSQTTKLAEARRQLIPFIQGLPDGVRFSITAFNSSYQRFGTGGVAATPYNRSGAINFINSFNAQGGTSLRPPLEALFNERPATIYLVSDGKPSESDQTILGLAQTAMYNGIVIHTIGVGEDQNQDLLRQMAQITGGVYSPQGMSIPFRGLLPK